MSKCHWAIACRVLLGLAAALPLASFAEARLVAVGSNTMEGLMHGWATGFRRLHGDVDIVITSGGSNTAVAALTEEGSMLAPMSRSMSRAELQEYRRRFDQDPLGVRVALDALAVFVHADNPVNGLTMAQLDAMFSSSRRCASGLFSDRRELQDWRDVNFGLAGSIALYGRDERSGTHDFFRETALCGGDFRAGVRALADSRSIIDAVARDPHGIGYAGIGFRDDRVKVVALSASPTAFENAYYSWYVDRYRDHPDLEKRYGWVVRGKYPLSRDLWLYLHAPGAPGHSDLARAFAGFALSAEGQAIVHETGFIPLPARTLKQELGRLGD